MGAKQFALCNDDANRDRIKTCRKEFNAFAKGSDHNAELKRGTAPSDIHQYQHAATTLPHQFPGLAAFHDATRGGKEEVASATSAGHVGQHSADTSCTSYSPRTVTTTSVPVSPDISEESLRDLERQVRHCVTQVQG